MRLRGCPAPGASSLEIVINIQVTNKDPSNLLTQPFVFHNQRVKVIRVTGIEDDLSPLTDALHSCNVTLSPEQHQHSHSFFVLATLLHIQLQTTPFLAVVQHENLHINVN